MWEGVAPFAMADVEDCAQLPADRSHTANVCITQCALNKGGWREEIEAPIDTE